MSRVLIEIITLEFFVKLPLKAVLIQNDSTMSMSRLHQERESITVDQHSEDLSKITANLDTKLEKYWNISIKNQL